jgi:ATP-dependent Lon protease
VTTPDALDRKANDVFAGKVVRKDLVRQVKVGANVPVYVLEFLLGKYCASEDPFTIEAGLVVVRQTLGDNFIRPDESEQAKAELKRKGRHRLIDKVDVRLVESEDKFWAHLANFGSNHVHIPEELVYKYDRLLGGGVWSQVELVYSADDDEALKRPFFITSLKPIQIAAFDLNDYAEGRARFSRDEWLDLVVRSMGLEPSELDPRQRLLTVVRLIPMAERNYNLIELGPRGTGKSFVYRESSPNAFLISGGRVTVPQLFVKLSGRPQVGLLGHWDVVAFDEVSALELSETTVIQMLKDYMESGSFARGKEETPAEASVVLIGNTSKATDQLVREGHLFADLPKAMIDTAFLDRLHYYLPGWEVPKLDRSMFTDHYGFVSDYFAEALRQLRKENYVMALDEEFALGSDLSARDERAVRKTVAGFLKILHPHGRWTRHELREYIELALEGRRRVKEQLRKMAEYEFSRTGFSYIERDSGREKVVEVPEQPCGAPGDPDGAPASASEPSAPSQSGTASLMAEGENGRVEFKATLRYNLHTRQRDDVIELQVLKALAGFMNAKGGTLLIGVDDQGSALGLDSDFALTGNKGRDGFENSLTTLADAALGKLAVANLSVRFDLVNGHDVCRIDVLPSRSPVYVTWKGGQQFFFVRLNNGTRPFSMSETIDYVRQRWR